MQLIAETAWHHQGDVDFLAELIDRLLDDGAQDIVKFHLTLDLAGYMLPDHPSWETLSDWMIPADQWHRILSQVAGSGKKLMLLYNDIESIEFGQPFTPALVELHAVNLNNFHMLDAVRRNLQTDQKIVIGVGGSRLEEIDAAVHRLDTDRIVLMFGFQNYPTRYDRINLARMRRIMKLYPEFEYGYADHCGFDEPNNILVTLLGAAQGCSYVEKHVTTRVGEKRCDYEAAVSVDMLTELKAGLDVLTQCVGGSALALSPEELKYGKMGMMKALAVSSVPIPAGTILQADMLKFRRTRQGSDLSQTEVARLIGAPALIDIPKGIPLRSAHFSKVD